MRIERASDDSAGLAIASGLSVDRRVLNQAVRNANDALSALSVAQGALNQLDGITGRLQELAAASANGVLTTEQRRALDAEGAALADEYNRIVGEVAFNDRPIFNSPGAEGAGGKLAITSQIGARAGQAAGEEVLSVQLGYGKEQSLELALGSELLRAVGDSSFLRSKTALSSAGNAQVVLSADFTGDGNADLVAASGSGDTFKLHRGNGDGTFQTAEDLGFGLVNTTAEAVDINGDGATDILTADIFSGTIEVALNDGSGGFKSRQYAAPIGQAEFFTTGDINGDGATDVVVGHSSSRQIAVMFGDELGRLTPGTTFDAGAEEPESLALADMNGDGHLDIIATSGASNSDISVFSGGGQGRFSLHQTYTLAGAAFPSIQIADVNYDGIQDIVASRFNEIEIVVRNHDGSVRARDTLSAGSGVSDVKVADLNGDGLADIFSAAANDNRIYIFENGSSGRAGDFALQQTLTSGSGPTSLAVADFDGNGSLDMAGANGNTGTLSIWSQGAMLDLSIPRLNLLNQEDARLALADLEQLRARVGAETAAVGSSMSRLDSAVQSLRTRAENYAAAESRIADLDVADQAARLTQLKMLQSAGAAVLAQANQVPGIALRLLGF